MRKLLLAICLECTFLTASETIVHGTKITDDAADAQEAKLVKEVPALAKKISVSIPKSQNLSTALKSVYALIENDAVVKLDLERAVEKYELKDALEVKEMDALLVFKWIAVRCGLSVRVRNTELTITSKKDEKREESTNKN